MSVRFVEYDTMMSGDVETNIWLEDGMAVQRHVTWFIRALNKQVDGAKCFDEGATHILGITIELKKDSHDEKSTSYFRLNTQELLGLAADIQAKAP